MIKYYLQDKSYYHGSYMNWWAKDSKGYTANLDNAHQFTFEELEEMRTRGMRNTDVAWLCSYIDGKSARCVSATFCNYDEMKEQESILLSRADNNGWIEIKDGGFEDEQEILITDGKSVWCDIVMCDYEDDVYSYCFKNGSNPDNVTHWQPKPKPPKE